MATIVIVEDEALLAKSIARTLRRQGHVAEIASNGEDGLRLWQERQPDLLLLDLRFQGMGGMEFLRRVRRSDPDVLVIVMTAYGEVETAVEAMKLGAQDFLRKPVGLDDLKHLVTRSLDSVRLKQRLDYFQAKDAAPGGESELVGNGGAIHDLREVIHRFATVAKVAAGDLPSILIQGETGSGKELVARNLHLTSPHASQPFIEINCASLPHNLVEAELFGFERGAFTDAKQAKPGLFELAENGTLFLDEIGELPPEIQAKLLRAIEQRRVRRLGGIQERPIACRILAATNRDLEQEIAAGAFRQDLFYRIAALRVQVPSLRERREDIIILANHFLAMLSRKYHKPLSTIGQAAGDAMLAYHWPGNVRELRHALERAVLLAPYSELEPEDLGLPGEATFSGQKPHPAGPPNPRAEAGEHPDSDRAPPKPLPPGATLRDLEREAILQALRECNGNVSSAARRLGLGREKLRYRLNKLKAEGFPLP